MFAES